MKLFKRYTTEEYVARAQEVHGDTYDYSSVVYTHNQNKVIITCPKHGPFPQMARAHLKGQGCNECGYERVRGWKNAARVEAKERGDKFFEGTPCDRGHTTRYVANSTCVKCHEEKSAAWRSNNKKRHKEMSEAWRLNNPERTAQGQLRRTRVRNKRVKFSSICADMPVVRDSINNIYDTARKISEQSGVDIHVDHIIPLAAENVCGLHVPWNMQITTSHYNCSKQNNVPEQIVAVQDWQNAVLVHESALPWKLKELQNGNHI